MTKKVTISEEQLTKVIKNILEQEIADDETLFNMEDMDDDSENIEDGYGEEIEGLEDELEQILTPEEIVGLMEEQIGQLQSRVQYVEELNADVLEFVEYLMTDLTKSEELDLRKSKQKLRALETRAGREIFWLKSRRL
tara:strand:+ start:225 stop:638 length:414 start_codon:yes stop_codon:yes gene_type:complete